jgi:hypothetical protein
VDAPKNEGWILVGHLRLSSDFHDNPPSLRVFGRGAHFVMRVVGRKWSLLRSKRRQAELLFACSSNGECSAIIIQLEPESSLIRVLNFAI